MELPFDGRCKGFLLVWWAMAVLLCSGAVLLLQLRGCCFWHALLQQLDGCLRGAGVLCFFLVQLLAQIKSESCWLCALAGGDTNYTVFGQPTEFLSGNVKFTIRATYW